MIQSEINKLKIALNKTEKCDKITVRWSDLLRNPARKAMLISLFVTVLNAFCGIAALLCYTGTVFKEAAGSDISPRMQAMSAIIVASIQFFGSFVTTNLVDRAGRKVNETLKQTIHQSSTFNSILSTILSSYHHLIYIVFVHCVDNRYGTWIHDFGHIYAVENTRMARGNI